MNIAVINARDLFKYILKFLVIVFILFLFVKGIKSIISLKERTNIEETIKTSGDKISKNSFLNCLDISISLMSYRNSKEYNNEILTKNTILAMGTGIFDKSIYENTDLVINEEELTIDDTEELINKVAELPENVTVENVSENNITPKVTSSYEGVQINNQSDYEITEDMLVPDVEITNKKDILIYHTHTCESYTASERI